MLTKIFEFIRSQFVKPSADVLAARELEEARRQLLVAQTAFEYSKCQAAFNTERIARLQRFAGKSVQS